MPLEYLLIDYFKKFCIPSFLWKILKLALKIFFFFSYKKFLKIFPKPLPALRVPINFFLLLIFGFGFISQLVFHHADTFFLSRALRFLPA